MKKNLFTVAAVALIAFVSCNKETNSPVQPAPVSDIKFEAEMVQTKTAIGDADDEGNRAVTWVLGDQVNINGSLFTAKGYKEDGKAIFETENLDFATADVYNAIYPATAGSSLEAVTIAAKQDGTFASAGVAVAQSENRSLAFMNVASIIKFQVPAAYASVTVESTANLAGTVSVTFDEDGTPVIGEVTNASKVITLNDVKADVDYYVAILPGDHKFTFNIDGRLSKEASKTLTATRAGILSLGVLPQPKSERNLKFSEANVTGYTSGWVKMPTLSGETEGVTYTSSSPDVAAVDRITGELSITEKKGTTTITASAPETDNYLAGIASYKLTVEQSNIRIYVRLWPKINNWDKWTSDPYIYYWGDYGSDNFPGNKLKYEKNNDQYDYYYEFEFSNSKKINFLVTCNQGEKSYDVNDITLNMNYYYSVYTEWHDGGLLTIHQDFTTNP